MGKEFYKLRDFLGKKKDNWIDNNGICELLFIDNYIGIDFCIWIQS